MAQTPFFYQQGAEEENLKRIIWVILKEVSIKTICKISTLKK